MFPREETSAKISLRGRIPRPAMLGLGMLAILLLVSVGNAEPANNQDYLNSLSIEDLAKIKVFSASRHLEDSRKAPAAVSIITAEEIKRYGWRTLGEALRSVRGFYTVNDRQYTYLGVRGMLRPGDYNTRILLQINGHRMNDNIYDQAMLGTEFPLDLDLIDHIEIIRGPGSSLFGSNAVFAVIDVITRRPKSDMVEVSGETGSFLTRSGRVTASAVKNKWSGLVSGTLYHSNGPEKLFFPEFASPAINNGFADNIDWDRVGQGFVDLQHGNLRVQSVFSNRNKSVPTASYGVIFNDPTSRDRDTRGDVDVSYHMALSPSADLDLRTYYDGYEYYGPSAYAGSSGRYVQITRQRADWAGGEANLGLQLGRQRLTLGTDYEYTFGASQKNYVMGQPPSFSVNDDPSLGAFYGEAELNLIPKVTIRAGGRLDWFSTFGVALDPRFAIIYNPTSRTTWKYIVGRAFRAPSSFEEFYADNISIAVPPVPLVPERVWSQEFVYEHSFNPWLSLIADGYFDDFDRIIEDIPSPKPGISYFVNQDHDHGRGVDVELEAKRTSGWAARASYSIASLYGVAYDSDGEPSSPRHQAKLNSTVPIARKSFVGLELLYFSQQRSLRGTPVRPTLLGDITFSTRPLWQNWEFSASCYNVFNRAWFAPMGPNDPESTIRMDGRGFRFKISYRLSHESH